MVLLHIRITSLWYVGMDYIIPAKRKQYNGNIENEFQHGEEYDILFKGSAKYVTAHERRFCYDIKSKRIII